MNPQQFNQWRNAINHSSLHQPKPLIMGILNVTPDSFSDGGRYFKSDLALKKALQMMEAGADLIDIGGESTRPGSNGISADEELSRVIPVIQKIRQESDICISIDTSKAEVMKSAVEAGASMINDVQALRYENALETAAKLDVLICLMHMQGAPNTMQLAPQYPQDDVLTAIDVFFQERIEVCLNAGIALEQIILDPGFGFGKSHQHNMQLVKNLAYFSHHHCPILLGVSRKSTIGALLNKSVDERMYGSLACAIFAVLHGAMIIRTHDVGETYDAFCMLSHILSSDK